MFGSAVIDTAIGIAFMFFLIAVFCSALVEWLANLFKKRAKYLLRGLQDLLTQKPQTTSTFAGMLTNLPTPMATAERRLYQAALGGVPAEAPSPSQPEPDWVPQIMNHPMVRPYKPSRATGEKTRNPPYLPAKTFVLALLDVADPGQGADRSGDARIAAIEERAKKLAGTPLGEVLRDLLKAAHGDFNKLTTVIEQWYDSQMESVGAAYRRWAKRWLIVIAIAVAGVLHVDAIAVGKALYVSEPLRDIAVASAGATSCNSAATAAAGAPATAATGAPATANAGAPATAASAEDGQCVLDRLDALGAGGLPVGWSQWSKAPPDGWLLFVLGITLTAFAASFGGPFWFDVLNKLGSFRNAGKKPATSS